MVRFHPSAPRETARLREPGTDFTNTLIGADLDVNGLERDELLNVIDRLRTLSRDGHGNRAVETGIVAALEAALARDGALDVPLQFEVKEGGNTLLAVTEAGRDDPTLLFVGDLEPDHRLPNVLLDRDVDTVHGTDPGNFYCEHMFFSAQMAASAPDSTVVRNREGEKLVGFLHMPPDAFTGGGAGEYTQATRHENSRTVIAAALSGLVREIRRTKSEPHVLLTGYEKFSWVENNPTGDFVRHAENIDAAMQRAFPGARRLEGSDTEDRGPRTLVYDVGGRKVKISTVSFPVEDSAISPDGERSIQRIMKDLSPHAVVSMGVAGGETYRAEHRADSGGLFREGNSARHVEGAPDRVRLKNNYSLARAIASGLA